MDAFQSNQRKVIASIAGAAILAVGIWQGLRLVGDGLAAKAGNAITLTGQARTSATADKVVWTLNVAENSKNVGPAVQKVEKSVSSLKEYLISGGIPADSIEVGGVNTYANNEYKNGNLTGAILSYTANQNVTVRSKDVDKVRSLSNGIGALLQTGVNVNNYGPQFYVSNLAELRPQGRSRNARRWNLCPYHRLGGQISRCAETQSTGGESPLPPHRRNARSPEFPVPDSPADSSPAAA